MRYYYFVSFLVVASLMSSCGFYRRDILFKASKEKEAEFAAISKQVKTPKNYLVQRNDYLEFQIFTNKGENVIDPTSEYQKQMSSAGATSQSSLVRYLIQADGCADLPIIGHTKLDSLTLHQVDSLLSKEYGKYYQDVFVVSRIPVRYVYIISNGSGSTIGGGGAAAGGGAANALELKRENTTLLELLSQMRGVGMYSHANRIKIIRGDLRSPTIFTIDLTRWDSFMQSNLIIQPNDVIYVEPARRKAFEFIRDTSQFIGILTTILSIYILTRL